MIKSNRIGILTDSLEDNCEFEICNGIHYYAKTSKTQVIIYEGVSNLHFLGLDNHYTEIKDFILNSALDGLIIFSGFMLEYYGLKNLKEYISSFSSIPMVSIALAIKNMPSIVSDNEKGLKELINHLTEIHECKNFSFVCGPKRHEESNLRLSIFKKLLHQKKIDFNQRNLIRVKTLTKKSGYCAAKELLLQSAIKPDAIVCGNDYIAYGVIKFLGEKGVNVPEDIIVTGYDDVDDSDILDIPLTTVKQNFFEIGYKALEQLFYILEDKKTIPLSIIKTNLIIRESCGCLSLNQLDKNFLDEDLLKLKKNNSIDTLAEMISILMSKVYFLSEMELGLVKKLLLAVAENSKHFDYRKIKLALLDFIENNFPNFQVVRKTKDVIKYFLINIHTQNSSANALSHFLQIVLEIINDILIREILKEKSKKDFFNWKYNVGNQILLNASSRTGLLEKLYCILPDMGIKSFFLMIYNFDDKINAFEKWQLTEKAIILIAYKNGQNLIPNGSRIFNTSTLLPDSTWMEPEGKYIHILLSFEKEHIGYMVVDYNPEEFREGYGVLRINIGTALRNIIGMERVNEKNKKKLNFFISIAHEIKTPLTLALNVFENYEKKHKNDKDLQLLKENLYNMKNDVINLIGLEKLDMGMFLNNHDDIVNLSSVLSSKSIQFQESASRNEIIIKSDIKKNVFIKIDPFALERILNNLFENAIKYNHTKGKIFVQLRSKNEQIILSIQNTGDLIGEADLPRVFDPYFQSTKNQRNSKGSGIGLSIVKKILDQIGAQIKAESSKEKGVIFTLKFQRICPIGDFTKEKHISSQHIVLPEKIEIKNERFSENKKTVFLIEDNRQMLFFLKANLSPYYNVYCASNGKDGLKLFSESPRPSIIITDIIMDRMDGYTFIEEVYSDKKNQDIPIIIITAKSTLNVKITALSRGCIDIIAKPFLINELLLKIKNILSISEKQQDNFINNLKTTLLESLQAKQTSLHERQKNYMLERLKTKYELSDREINIANSIHKNFLHKQIANQMNMSEQTIRNISHIIYKKCFVTSKKELIILMDSLM